MALPNDLVQIPTPFNDLACRRKNSNETERVNSIERQSMQGGVCSIRRNSGAHGIDYLAATDGVAADSCLDRIPVDERKRRALVVEGDPGSAPRFRRSEHRTTVHHPFSRRESGGARQFFVAVHPKAVAPSPRDECDGTHCSIRRRVGSGQTSILTPLSPDE